MQKLSKLILFLFLFLIISYFKTDISFAITSCPTAKIQCGQLDAGGGCASPCLRVVTSVGGKGPSWCACQEPISPPVPIACGGSCQTSANCRSACPFCRASGPGTGFTCQASTTNSEEAFPKIGYPCDGDGLSPEFHSLRPYQAAVCGDANKALYCSNELKFIESFDLTRECPIGGHKSDFDCDPGFNVDEHNLYVELTDSMFPIMGNTEDTFDDAQKVNEYASWYLSGVNNRAEYGENTDERVVNFSGPIQKLLPSMIQEAQRISVIASASALTTYTDEDTQQEVENEPLNHNQIVVCAKEEGLGWLGDLLGIGVTNPKPCYSNDKYRLKEWNDDLSIFNGILNRIGTDIWNKRTPPLPWADKNGDPFESQQAYQKAYNEWRGESCAKIPFIDLLLCIDNPFVPNKWADLYQYIPLSNTTDKKGAERILDVMFKPSNGTEIANEKYDEANKKSAPLYFAHTEEVKESSKLLNTTYLPKDYKSEPLPETTEKNVCSAVNVRTNKGDNLFPGDRAGTEDEIVIPGVTYDITQVLCKVTKTTIRIVDPKTGRVSENDVYTHHCNAEVILVVPTDIKVPNADEIFSTTVADSGSTFRKIFPKVEDGAPVSCIADIPTVTSVTYNAEKSETPNRGTLEFKVKKYPEDSAGDNPELTFPHIGSVYEYFLKGIQTALRPQGYGNEQPVSGQTCTNIQCGELPKGLPKASGSCNLGGISSRVGNIPNSLKDIINAAAQTYKTPPNLILGVMFGEGLFNPGRFNWTDQNVKNWATCQKIPNCNETGDDNFMGFNGTVFERTVPKIKADLQKADPTRKKFSQCNLMDSIYAIAYNLHDSADGGGGLPATCFGISLNSTVPTSCSWNDSQYESAIKVSESGYTSACITKEGGCLTGGGLAAACGTGDTCETKDVRYLNPSHNACVWDVAHGQ